MQTVLRSNSNHEGDIMSFFETLKGFGRNILNGLKAFWSFLSRNQWLFCLLLGLIINFVTECMHRHSFTAGVMHVVHSPLPYLFNSLIVTAAMSVCSLFKKRYFLYCFVGAVFFGFGVANCILLLLRVTPLEWADIQVVKISLITKYLSTFQIILICVLIAAAIAALVVIFIKCTKKKINYLKEGITAAGYTVLLIVSLFSFRAGGILLAQHTKNLANAYKDYGFYYCFLCSVLDLGIDEPQTYTESDIIEIADTLNTAAAENGDIRQNAASVQDGSQSPNVIFVQLETFFDINHLSSVDFSENPIPNFSKLHKEFTSGYIGVPSIGAGTANTEFEIISGMNLQHFGMGEYPYKTVLQTKASESICFDLKNNSYATHAIHNNTATFYDRNIVFGNLGFDTFTSLEYMQDVEYNSIGWAKDGVLVGCINDCLDSTEGSDFVYTITVQSHGKYPSDYTEELPITADGFSDDVSVSKQFEYYINQLHEVDMFIGELIESLSKRDERTVVVLYGDHLPSFEISSEDLEGGDLFSTEYVIWDNFGLNNESEDVYAYQIGSKVLGLLGYDDGILTKLHQNFSDSENYQEWLRTLEYDMLYGERYAFGGEENYPYVNTGLKMGAKDVIISDVRINDDATLEVFGENFTEYSRIYINDNLIDTIMVDNGTLTTSGKADIAAGDLLAVVQVNSSGTSLSSSKLYLIGGTQENPTVTVDSDNIVYLPQGFKLSTAIAITVAAIAVISVSISVTVVALKKKKNKEHNL